MIAAVNAASRSIMNVKGISWVGVKTPRFDEMVRFLEQVIGLRVSVADSDFRMFRLPDGDQFEVFGPAGPDPPAQFARNRLVAGFLVDDIDHATQELLASGVELIGPLVRTKSGYAWQHFRAPDGNVYELAYDPAHR